MVRLVFRPYTQIRRTICTSVSLRASTRVSPGVALFRHRSPSFGSQHVCSYSNLTQALGRSIVPPCGFLPQTQSALYFHFASGFCTQILAYMSDSLVRVSRRVDKNHFVNIPTTQNPIQAVPSCQTGRTLFSQAIGQAGKHRDAKRVVSASAAPRVEPLLAREDLRTAFSPEHN